MKPIKKDVVIIGGGPAGLAIANQLYKSGTKDIILLEREKDLGAYSASVSMMLRFNPL